MRVCQANVGENHVSQVYGSLWVLCEVHRVPSGVALRPVLAAVLMIGNCFEHAQPSLPTPAVPAGARLSSFS